MSEDVTGETIRRKARRIRDKRRARTTLFAHLAHVGVLGWVFILPVVGLTYLGYLGGQSTGQRWLAVAGLLAGLAIGAYLTWRNVRDGLRGPPDGPTDQGSTDEEGR